MKELRKLLHFVKPYRWLALAAILLLATQAMLDLSIPRLIQRIVDQGIKAGDMSVVLQTSALMLGFTALSALAAIGNNSVSIRAGEGVARDLREAIFLKIQNFSYGNIDHFTTGGLMIRLSSDSAAVQRLVQITLRIGTRGPLMMIGSLILMFNTNRQLALTMLPLLGVTSALIMVFAGKMEPLFRGLMKKLDRLNTVMQENVAGVRLVKAFVRADFEKERFDDANRVYMENHIQVMRFMSSLMPLLTILMNISLITIIWAGGLQAIQGSLTVGEIIAFSNYTVAIMGPLLMMTMISNMWANATASAQRINEVLDTEPEVQDAPNASVLDQTSPASVEFKDAQFAYNGSSDRRVLDGVSFEAKPGQTVAILGATGSGKSTLINLIPRFYDVTSGRVEISGEDVRAVTQASLLARTAIVPQETVLFSGSVADNIRYGRPEATDEEVTAAAQAAQAHKFISAMPQGYATHIEERGTNLSGGQKQRIAIARALLLNPDILILDDSTSSVDVDTETRIQAALATQQKKRVTFMVAQRISTVLNADKILVLEKGRIAAEGTHAELIKTSSIYKEIYDSQLGGSLNGSQAQAAAESVTA